MVQWRGRLGVETNNTIHTFTRDIIKDTQIKVLAVTHLVVEDDLALQIKD